MRAFATMAHYDPRGRVAPHVRRHVEALTKAFERVVVVSTADLEPADEAWLVANCELHRRANYGYDFFSYRAGLLEAGNLEDYDRVVICNDSFVGPLQDYEQILEAMSRRPVDFWGLTGSERVAPHVQSFFVCFMPWVVRSHAFQQFWQRMSPVSDRLQVIRRYEVGMSTALQEAGFAGGSYFTENDADRRIGRLRVLWWAALRAQKKPARARLGAFRRFATEAWNPCAGLADRALGESRLPLVKIDTLRYDPYGLGADSLLSACEAAYPEQFGDIRTFLAETARFYPPRKGEVLPAPVAPLRVAYPAVRYR